MVSIVLGGIVLFFCGVTGAERSAVTVEQGTLQGVKLSTVWGKEYHAFRGIRYAKPPVGKLRFQASWFLYV
jgi:acetylcholinesterase